MEACNTTHVPMKSSLRISKVEYEPEINATEYRRTIGCLRYLRHTRPDICYAVGVLSRYTHNLRKSHQTHTTVCKRNNKIWCVFTERWVKERHWL